MSIGSAVGAGVGLLGGVLGRRGAQGGYNQAAMGQLAAAQIQQQMFQQAMANLQPFIGYGQSAYSTLAPLIGLGGDPLSAQLTSRFAPTMERLAQTPGYQFMLDQGLRATQNAFAAKGLGTSGNALRGAAEYASGLAEQTFQRQLENYWKENQAIYNMLAGVGQAGLGAAGAGMTGAAQFGQQIGQNVAGAGQAMGQGQIAGTGSLIRGIGNAYGLATQNPPSWWNNNLVPRGFWQ